MQENERRIRIEAWQGIARRQGEAKLPGDRNPKCFRQFQVAIDGVGAAIHLCNLMVQQARTLTAIAHSPELARMADAADQGTSEQALKIKGHVRPERLCFFYPRPHAARYTQAAKVAP